MASASPAAILLRPTRLSPSAWLVAAGAVAGAVVAGVLVGPADLAPAAILGALLDRLPGVRIDHGLSEQQLAILWQLRVPRVVLGGLVGAMLAGGGAAYQGVFRNALADPYLLGVAAGGGLGATIAVAYVPDRAAWAIDPLPLAAFLGGLVSVAITYSLGRSASRFRSTAALVLAGVAVASFLTATQTFVQQQNTETLREVYSWILGRLSTLGWREVLLMLPYAAVSAVVLVLHRRLMDVLSIGDEEAESVGVRAARVRLLVVLAATLGTSAAVAVSGLIGFVGIIVPHTVRLLTGDSYRRIVPLSLALGAAFMILADILSRSLLAPAELPIGVVTAFFGAPFFLLVLRRSRRA